MILVGFLRIWENRSYMVPLIIITRFPPNIDMTRLMIQVISKVCVCYRWSSPSKPRTDVNWEGLVGQCNACIIRMVYTTVQ